MINTIGNPLANLIREIAYTKGALNYLDRSLSKLRSQIEPLEVQYRQLQAQKQDLQIQLATLEAKLQAKCPELSTGDIRGIQKVPKTLGKPYGALIHVIVSALSSAEGPVDTRTLVRVVATNLEMPVATSAEYDLTRRAICRRVRTLVHKGAVERLPDTFLEDGQKVGVWLWKGL